MPLQKRLVVYGRVPRDGPELDTLLRSRGFQVYGIETEEDLYEAIEFAQPDAVVLCSPYDADALCRVVSFSVTRGRCLVFVVRPGIPVADATALLDAGADYVTGSFQPDLLAGQIRAMLRRYGMQRRETTTIELGYLSIDLQRREVAINDQSVSLTRTEFDVLRVLAERPGTVLPSGEIMQHVMGIRMQESEAQDLLKVHIHRLRQKLEKEPDNPKFIRTVRGQGYMYAFERRLRDRRTRAAARAAS